MVFSHQCVGVMGVMGLRDSSNVVVLLGASFLIGGLLTAASRGKKWMWGLDTTSSYSGFVLENPLGFTIALFLCVFLLL